MEKKYWRVKDLSQQAVCLAWQVRAISSRTGFAYEFQGRLVKLRVPREIQRGIFFELHPAGENLGWGRRSRASSLVIWEITSLFLMCSMCLGTVLSPAWQIPRWLAQTKLYQCPQKMHFKQTQRMPSRSGEWTLLRREKKVIFVVCYGCFCG